MRLLDALKDTVLGIGSIVIFAALLASCGGGGGGKETSSDRSDATLEGLAVTPGTLSPAFSPAVIAYATDVIADTASIDVTGTVAAANATMVVGGAPAASGMAHTVPLPIVGANPIAVVVLAANGITTKTYTITVTRPSISLTPVSSDITVSGSIVLTVRLAATAGVGGSEVTLNATPPVGLPTTVTVPEGQTQISLTVTAPATPGLVTIMTTLGAETATAAINVM